MSRKVNQIRSRDGSASPTPRASSTTRQTTTKLKRLELVTNVNPSSTKPNDSNSSIAIDDHPTMPLTPNSPVFKTSTLQVPPSADLPVTQDTQTVDELLVTMKRTLVTLGCSFETLGRQAVTIAELPIAIDAIQKIAGARKEVEERQKEQNNRMQDLGRIFSQNVKKLVQNEIKARAKELVKEVIAREVAQRVKVKLEARINQTMREDMIRYKRRMARIEIELYNSEARRHNASISPNEPLRELLRPLQTPAPSPVSASARRAATVSGSAQPSLTVNTDAVGGSTPPLSALMPDPPTPSPDFPRYLTTFVKLRLDQARALARDYNFNADIGNAVGTVEFANQFLVYIGVVGLRVVSPRTDGQGRSPYPASPLLTRIST